MNLDEEAKRIFGKIGHDTPVWWEDKDSGIRVKTSCYNMKEASNDLNQTFVSCEFATLADFYDLMEFNEIIFPEHIQGHENSLQNAGWCWQCCNDWDGPWINIEESTKQIGSDVIFEFWFVHKYCDGCYDCMGCDAPLTGLM